MGKKKDRIDVSGGGELSQNNPFAGLSGLELPQGGKPEIRPRNESIPDQSTPRQKRPSKETLLLRRLKSGKGGKVVTEISGFDADPGTISRLLKRLQGQMGTGGTCKGKVLELQGECRERLKPILEADGYRVKGI